MLHNYTVKNINDLEKPIDSPISSTEFGYNVRSKTSMGKSLSSNFNALETESFDNILEKRNRKS